jgi:hypothetical protein
MKDLELLRQDEHYYGEIGRKYISNSDIGTLLNDPRQFKANKKDNIAFAGGRLFHQLMLEPEKAVDFPYVEASNRNTKIYKDFIKEKELEFAMLEKEYTDIHKMTSYATQNLFFFENVLGRDGENEVPAIGEIMGQMFKAKADRVLDDIVLDLKSTSDIKKFKWSAYNYNYDSQAYIYQTLFGKPMVFFVVDKNAKEDFRGNIYYDMGVYPCSEEFVASGEAKVARALEIYNKFYGKDANENTEDFIINLTL